MLSRVISRPVELRFCGHARTRHGTLEYYEADWERTCVAEALEFSNAAVWIQWILVEIRTLSFQPCLSSRGEDRE